MKRRSRVQSKLSVLVACAALGSLFALGACSPAEGEITQALIEDDADRSVVERLTALEVETYDIDAPASREQPRRVASERFTQGAEGPRALRFPLSFGVEKRRSDRFLLVITGYAREALVIEQKLQLTFIAGQARVAQVQLAESCYARDCSAPGDPDWFVNTCHSERGGACSAVMETPSTALDAPRDASAAARNDASASATSDASSASDAGVSSAGSDASFVGVQPAHDASVALDAATPKDATTVDANQATTDAAAQDASVKDATVDAAPSVLGGFVRVSHDNFQASFGGFTGDSRGYPVTARSGPCLLQTRDGRMPLRAAGTLSVTRKGTQTAMLQPDSGNYYYGWTFMNFVTSANDNVREQGPIVVAASGGEVPAFSVQLDVPQSSKDMSIPTTLKRGQDLLVQWSPQLLAAEVSIEVLDPAKRDAFVVCTVATALGKFAVPGSLLSGFPTNVELWADVGGRSAKTIDAGPYKVVVFLEAPLLYKVTLTP